MPFSNPSEGNFADPESGKYIARIQSIDDGDDYGYGPTLFWRLELADEKGPLYTEDGQPFVWSPMTSTSLGKGSKGRKWAEGFLGRSIADMTGEQVSEALVGAIGKILVGPEADGKGEMRQRLLAVEPFDANAPAPARSAPKREPVGAAPGGNPFNTPV